MIEVACASIGCNEVERKGLRNADSDSERASETLKRMSEGSLVIARNVSIH